MFVLNIDRIRKTRKRDLPKRFTVLKKLLDRGCFGPNPNDSVPGVDKSGLVLGVSKKRYTYGLKVARNRVIGKTHRYLVEFDKVPVAITTVWLDEELLAHASNRRAAKFSSHRFVVAMELEASFLYAQKIAE